MPLRTVRVDGGGLVVYLSEREVAKIQVGVLCFSPVFFQVQSLDKSSLLTGIFHLC